MRRFGLRPLLAVLLFDAALVAAATARPKGSFRQCTDVSPECPVEGTLYGYRPILGVNAFFLALFGLCFFASLITGIITKTWTYTLALSIGTFLETVGYAGRIIMHSNPWSSAGFKAQICALVLGPSFVAAAIYLTLKHFVLYCGPQHSFLKPRLYPWVFVGCDFGSMVLQGIGGGVAAAAGNSNKKLIDMGNNLIVAGIAFQVVTMAVCGLLVLLYIWRYRRAQKSSSAAHNVDGAGQSAYHLDKHSPSASGSTIPLARVKTFAYTVSLAYLTVLIRCIYRIPEMAGGWGNPLMRNEKEFLLLDGMMLGIACLLLTLVHPAFFFPPFAAFRKSRGSKAT